MNCLEQKKDCCNTTLKRSFTTILIINYIRTAQLSI